MSYLQIFLEFFNAGMFAVGGGLATTPFLRVIDEKYHLFSGATGRSFTDMLAVSQALPGAIGVNMSIYTGVSTGRIFGGALAGISLVCPAIIVIMIISRFMEKFRNSRMVENAFYGIRPASSGLIIAAVLPIFLDTMFNFKLNLKLDFNSDISSGFSVNWKPLSIYIIVFMACLVLEKKKTNPVMFIISGAIAGALLKA